MVLASASAIRTPPTGITDWVNQTGTHGRHYVDFGEAYADLAAGRLAAVVNSLPNQLEAARQRPDAFEVVLPTFGPKKYFSWAGRKDEESASLNSFMDEQIRALNESGTLAELQRKWFGDVMELPSDELPEPAE